MKTRVLLVVLVCIVAGVLPAQEGDFVAPWKPPVPDVEDGAQLIAIGFWGDVIGIGLVTSAGAVMSLSFDAGVTTFQFGLISMLLVGNPCLQKGLEQHHQALVAAGYDVPTDNRDRSRLFSRIALGCGGGAVALGLGAAIAQSTGLAITSLVAGTTGAVFEIINFYNFRRNWGIQMKEAAGLQ